MDLGQRKEQFNLAYIHAIAAQAGFDQTRPSVDDDSVDLVLKGKNFIGRVRNPAVELQLKCTANPTIRGDLIKFSLPVKNYNDLRGTNILSPRYLVVLLVPGDLDDWIVHDAKHMALHNLCFWASLRGLPDVTNLTSVTVDVPMRQRLTTDSMTQLLTLASNGESA